MNDIDNEMLFLIEKNENVVNREKRKCCKMFSVSVPKLPTNRPISITKKEKCHKRTSLPLDRALSSPRRTRSL